MIAVRFRILPNKEEETWMHQQQDKCLNSFVLNLLRVEAGFDNLDPSTKSEIEDVVREELLKSGLGKEVIFGEPTPAQQRDAQIFGQLKQVIGPRTFQTLTGETSPAENLQIQVLMKNFKSLPEYVQHQLMKTTLPVADVVSTIRRHAEEKPQDREKLKPVLEQLAAIEREQNPKSNSGCRNAEEDRLRLIPLLEEALSEADRVYRNQVAMWSSQSKTQVALSGRGLLKARLIAGAFVGHAFARIWAQKSEAEVMTFCNALSGAAWEPFVAKTGYPHLERSDAVSFASGTIWACLAAIQEEFSSPKTDVMPTSDGFKKLIEFQHDALTESIGRSSYQSSAKQILESAITSTVSSYLHLSARCITLLD
jgi:hypothetical protein